MFLSALSHRGEASLLKYNFKVMIIGMDGHLHKILVKVTSPPKGVGLFKLLLQMPFFSFGMRSWSPLGRSCLPLCCLSGENDNNHNHQHQYDHNNTIIITTISMITITQ